MGNVLSYLVWIAAAALAGFGISAIFSGILRIPRSVYLLIYVPLSLGIVVIFAVWSSAEVAELFTRNWYWGLLGAAVAGLLTVRNVLGQKPSPRKRGAAFAIDVIWPGAAYGAVDALLLSVLPVVAVNGAFADMAWTTGRAGQFALGAAGLAASLIVTVAYHLGYIEFRNKRVWWTVLGNGIFTLAFLITSNALAAVLPHIAMHIASIAHGRETTIQLPPHYGGEQSAV
jgi:hypothetical protein